MNTKGSAREKKYFRMYYNMGPERSLKDLASKLNQDKIKMGIKIPPSVQTLRRWSSEYGWAKRIEEWDEKMVARLDKQAIEEAVISNEQILKISSAVIYTFAKQLKGRPLKTKAGEPVLDKKGNPIMEYNIRLTPFDVKMMWDLQQHILKGRELGSVNVVQSVILKQAVIEIENLPDENAKKKILIKLNEINTIIDKAYGRSDKETGIQDEK